jgi:hypothetical protein
MGQESPMDEKDRPETDLENLLQQAAERFSIQEDVLAPVDYVREFLASDPPHLEHARILDVTYDPVDEALTRVTFHLESTAEGALAKVASVGGFDFRAARGELERWKSACQVAHGGVGPVAEMDRLSQVLKPPD